MQDKLFYTPVGIVAAIGEKLEIGTLAEAHRFLAAQPEHDREAHYQTARRACEAAAAGHITMEQARRALVAYAEKVGVLWPDTAPAVAYRAVARGYGGFAA